MTTSRVIRWLGLVLSLNRCWFLPLVPFQMIFFYERRFSQEEITSPHKPQDNAPNIFLDVYTCIMHAVSTGAYVDLEFLSRPAAIRARRTNSV